MYLMNKTFVQILKNIASSWGVIGLKLAIGLFMVPFLLGHLGKDGYGVVGIITSIIGFTGIADLGLRNALNRELSESVANRDIHGFRRLSSSALLLYIGIAVLISFVGCVCAPGLYVLFNIGPMYEKITILLLRTYMPLMIIVSFVIPVFSSGISSFMRYDVQNNITMFSQLCASFVLFLSLIMSCANPLIVWCLVTGGAELIRLGGLWIFYRKICFGGLLLPSYIYVRSLIPLFKLGGSMYILQLARVLAERMDPLIISHFLGVGGVALYQVGSKLPLMVAPVVLAGTNQIMPLVTKFHVTQNQQREHQSLIYLTRYTVLLGAIFSSGMIVFADPFCHLWLSNELGNATSEVANILKIWAGISFMNWMGGAQFPFFLSKKKLKFAVWINVPTALMNIALSAYFVGYTSLGVKGVLIGTIISILIRRPLSIWYVSRILNISLSRYIRKAFVPGVIIWLISLASGSIAQRHVSLLCWTDFVVSLFGFLSFCSALFVLSEHKLLGTQVKKYVVSGIK